MNHIPVTSSNIYSIAHCPETQTLQVRFKDRNGAPTSLYEYSGVPAWVFSALQNADSVGGYFAKFIKGKFDGYPVV